MSKPRSKETRLRHAAEFVPLYFAQALGSFLPLRAGAKIGDKILGALGPKAGRSRIADKNLSIILPDLSADERKGVIKRMWANFGRSIVEAAALRRITVGSEDWPIHGGDALKAAAGGPTLLFGAHFANWSTPLLAARWAGHDDLSLVYRRANNPEIDKHIIRLYGWIGVKIIHKGAAGARDIMAALKRGGTVFMLMDQKMNDGVSAPFMGQPAMTAGAIGQLALRFDAQVFPIHGVRRKADDGRWTATQDIYVEPPMRPKTTGDRQADALAFVEEVNDVIGRWVTDDPDQWLWIHRRWGRWEEKGL